MNPTEEQGPNRAHSGDVDDAVIGRAFRRSLAVIAVLAVGAVSVVLWLRREQPQEGAEEASVTPVAVRSAPEIALPTIPFRDVTIERGLSFRHHNGAVGQKLLPETMGGGVAFLDHDGDGDQDVILIDSADWSDASTSRSVLFENDGRGHFMDVTEARRFTFSGYGMGCAVGDYDNDGRVDVYVSALGANRLLRNTPDGFEDVTDAAGVGGTASDWSTSCGWLDYDNDGDLDLLVLNYVVWSAELDLAKGFTLDGKHRAYGRPQEFDGTFPALYRNEGDGTFREVSEEAGLNVRNPATSEAVAKSLGLSIADFDRNGWLDFVVANDTVQNFLFMNNGDGTFREVGGPAGVAFDVNGQARGAMGIDVAHFRNSDVPGIAIGNFATEMTALYVLQSAVGGIPQFSDEAVSNGLGPVTRTELTFGIFFFDADLDGRLDVFAANGHLEEDIKLVQRSQSYEQPPQLLWNCGSDQPTEYRLLTAEQCSADFVKPMVGRGAAYADIDGDGDLDVLIGSVGGGPRLLLNEQQLGHDWLRVRLAGTGRSNRSAIGARLELQTESGTMHRVVMPTRSYLSQCELPVTFGLGGQIPQKLVIHWPDGAVQERAIETVNLELKIEQPAAE